MQNNSFNDPKLKNEFDEDESIKAQAILNKTKGVKRVNDPTRLIIAKNLGVIISSFGRELSRAELIKKALGIDPIKPQERLGRFQITPNKKEISESKKKYLSHNLENYIKIAEAAADLTENRRPLFINMLFDNTRFISDNEEESIEPGPVDLIFDHLKLFLVKINEKYSIKEYYKKLQSYEASPAGLVKQKDGYELYEFTSDYDLINDPIHQRNTPPTLTSFSVEKITQSGLIYKPLYRIIHSSAIADIEDCNGDLGRRKISFVEKVLLAVIPDGLSGEPSLFFLTTSFIYVHAANQKNKNFPGLSIGINQNTKETGTWNSWTEFLTRRPKKVSWEKVKEEFEQRTPLLQSFEINNHYNIKILKGQKLDLSLYRKHKKEYSYFRMSPLSVSSIKEFMDIPREKILRERNDAFIDYYDVSRAISPTSSMLSEVEINLFYDGFRTSFDDSHHKSTFEEHAYYSNMYSEEFNEDGYPIPRPKEQEVKPEDYYHGNSITRHLEIFASQLVFGFIKWREKIRKETFSKANKKRLEIEKEITKNRDELKRD